MSITSLSRMASLTLAFGLFFACSSPNPFVEDTKSYIDSGNYRMALQAANRGVADNPENAEIHYFKGLVHYRMAEAENSISAKLPHYQQMGSSFETVLKLYEEQGTSGRRTRELTYLRSNAWATEHNAGATIINDENRRSLNDLRVAVDHLRSATYLLPDSVSSHMLLSEAYLRLNDSQQALRILQESLEKAPKNKAGKIHERIAFVALKIGNYDLAMNSYRQMDDEQRRDPNLAHGLLNMYQRNQNHEKALELARELLVNDRDNSAYQQIVAAQSHQLSMILYERWLEGYQAEEFLDFSDNNLIIEARELETESLSTYRILVDRYPDNTELLGLSGIVHQNFFFMKDAISKALVSETDAALIQEESEYHKENALNWLTEVSEIAEEPFRYWEALILIHSHLGNEEEANKYIRLMESAL